MGNIVDNVVLVNSGRAFDGPRINPNLLSHSLKDKLKTSTLDDENLILKEQQVARERLEKLSQVSEKALQFQRYDASYSRTSQRNDFPSQTFNKEVPVINEKTVSYGLLLNVIGRRFHECLQQESKSKPDLAEKLSDSELVHQVCRKERLTFYNFLKEHTHDQLLNSEEGLKEQLNKEYGIYFHKNDPVEIYGAQYLKADSVFRGNSLNKRFDVAFESAPK